MSHYAISAVYRNGALAGGIAEGGASLIQWISIKDKNRWHVSLLNFPSHWTGSEIGQITEHIRLSLP